jgi:hypothetical protein
MIMYLTVEETTHFTRKISSLLEERCVISWGNDVPPFYQMLHIYIVGLKISSYGFLYTSFMWMSFKR